MKQFLSLKSNQVKKNLVFRVLKKRKSANPKSFTKATPKKGPALITGSAIAIKLRSNLFTLPHMILLLYKFFLRKLKSLLRGLRQSRGVDWQLSGNAAILRFFMFTTLMLHSYRDWPWTLQTQTKIVMARINRHHIVEVQSNIFVME